VIRRRIGAELEEVVVGLFENLEAKGRAEGEAKGKAEGKAEGRAEVVLKLLTLKFGPLAPDTVVRVRGASVEELDRFAERILFATALDEVLG
jgi:predicted transposase YdaD